jgi:UDP-3-O-[3-hydroxymyristoyl] N-acetylglucosamine deacetylase
MEYQKTIKREIGCNGIGLHSGKQVSLKMLPAEPDTGVVFRRVDLGNAEIKVTTQLPSAMENLNSLLLNTY